MTVPGGGLLYRVSMAMAGFPRYYIDDGSPGALCMHLGLYCAVAGCLAFGFYLLMQPARSPNPGLTAYRRQHLERREARAAS
jgi:hypothetical protein